MKRQKCIEAIYPELQDKLVVTIMGACAQELYDLGHCENFFYLEHAMGLASSIGLGLALNLPEEKVVVMDGDGSVLMNLGTLTTLARYRPRNMTHIIFDNGSLLSTGGFASHTTSGVIDLAPMFAPSPGFSIETISCYDEKGPGWYWNTISLGEHTGTHFDAPVHWITGKDYANNTTDTIPAGRFVGPAYVMDVSKEVA